MRRLQTGSIKGARDVTAEVNPNKQQANPLARFRRKLKVAGLKQVQKWARRQLKVHSAFEADLKAWQKDLPEDSPLTVKNYPRAADFTMTSMTLAILGQELAKRSQNDAANKVMERFTITMKNQNQSQPEQKAEETCPGSPTTD